MPGMPGLDNLSVLRVSRIVRALQDERLKEPPTLTFSARLNEVPAANGELFARFVGRVLIADLIADDARAGIYSSGKFTFETSQVPKIKIGRGLSESQIRLFNDILGGRVDAEDDVRSFLGPIVSNALDGIEHRKEALAVAMMRDELNYDRLGYKANGITWGMPSELKVTPSVPWTTAASATPIDDILNVKLVARTRYGIDYNRATMSTQAFRYAIATTEFQNKAKVMLPSNITFTNLSLLNLQQQQGFFEAVSGVTVKLTDDRYWYENENGDQFSERFLPINEVILDDSRNDRRNAVWDMAKGEVIESMFIGMNPTSIVGAGEAAGRMPRRGPIGYMTYPPDLNPPPVTLWGVDCAFPRKHLFQANAKLTVGSFTDTIAVSEII